MIQRGTGIEERLVRHAEVRQEPRVLNRPLIDANAMPGRQCHSALEPLHQVRIGQHAGDELFLGFGVAGAPGYGTALQVATNLFASPTPGDSREHETQATHQRFYERRDGSHGYGVEVRTLVVEPALALQDVGTKAMP